MRLFVMVLILAVSGVADRIAVQTIACKSEKALTEMPKELLQDALEVVKYAAKHQCVVLSENDLVQVVSKNPDSSKTPFLSIVVQGTGEHYYVPRRSVIIEQPGQKNRFTF